MLLSSTSASFGSILAIACVGHDATHTGPAAEPAHRSHFTATSGYALFAARGAIWMLSHGHAFAQLPHPVQRSSDEDLAAGVTPDRASRAVDHAARVLAVLAAVRDQQRRPLDLLGEAHHARHHVLLGPRGHVILALHHHLVAAADEARDAVVMRRCAAPRAVTTAHARVLVDDEQRARHAHAIEVLEHVRGGPRPSAEELRRQTGRAHATRAFERQRVAPRHDEEHVARDGHQPGRSQGHDRDATHRAILELLVTEQIAAPEIGLDARLPAVVGLRLQEPVGDEIGAFGHVALAIDVLAARDLDMPHGIEEHLEIALGQHAREASGSQQVHGGRALQCALQPRSDLAATRTPDGATEDRERYLGDERGLAKRRPGLHLPHAERHDGRLLAEHLAAPRTPDHGRLCLAAPDRGELACTLDHDVQRVGGLAGAIHDVAARQRE